MNTTFSPELFLSIQDECDNYNRALRELYEGCKRTHWIWFVFPQIAGLGHSEMAQRYALYSLEEARNYWAHPELSQRLRLATEALLHYAGEKAPREVLGKVDALKVRSSMTLFSLVAPNDVFSDVLDQMYDGERCAFTLEKCASEVEG